MKRVMMLSTVALLGACAMSPTPPAPAPAAAIAELAPTGKHRAAIN
jgi:hypothetical protein